MNILSRLFGSKAPDTPPESRSYQDGEDIVQLSAERIFADISKKTVGDVVLEWIQLTKEVAAVRSDDNSSAGEWIYNEVNAGRNRILDLASCSPRHITIGLQSLDYSYSRSWTEDDLSGLRGTSRPPDYMYSDTLA